MYFAIVVKCAIMQNARKGVFHLNTKQSRECAIHFIMAFQWCCFKGTGSYNCSTIFSTNNLRQFITATTYYFYSKESEHLNKLKFYGFTLLSYHAGVAFSYLAWSFLHISSIYLCLIPLPVAFLLITYEINLSSAVEMNG